MRELQNYPDPDQDNYHEDPICENLESTSRILPTKAHQARASQSHHHRLGPADEGLGESAEETESMQGYDDSEDHVLDDAIDEDLVKDDLDKDSSYTPHTRSMRRSSQQSAISTRRRSSAVTNASKPRSKVTKRPTNSNTLRCHHHPQRTFKTQTSFSKHMATAHENPRPFRCSFHHYGCTALFPSKNEWKRHVNSQHIRPSFWRCDQCVPTSADSEKTTSKTGSDHNDFNRKDLFTQHLRRMHAPWGKKNPTAAQKRDFEDQLEDVRQRCVIEKRNVPSKSGCNFCERFFDGVGSWEDRMEHVGKHFEKGEVEDREDDVLQAWALSTGIIRPGSRGSLRCVSFEEECKESYRADEHGLGLGEEDAEGELE